MLSIGNDPFLTELTAAIAGQCTPERIILFGSRGRGDHTADSDYDLVVVIDAVETPSALESSLRHAVLGRGRAVDLFVQTAAAFERDREAIGSLAHEAHVDGRVLYERVPVAPRRVREPPRDYVAKWRERAEHDFQAMMLAATNPVLTDIVAFHAHQAVEKFLKAALIRQRIRPPRTHVLAELLAKVSVAALSASNIRERCATLDELWTKSRYPNGDLPSIDEAERAIEYATHIRSAIIDALLLS